ncbi:MAG: VOC family protein [Acidimicrobiia bacterium]|nr:VOC family protein [Acidimicrobiia bacterium]
MGLGAVSHLAFGVADMDRSLAFYRDLLGMEVTSDRTHATGGGAMYDDDRPSSRRVAQLRWGEGRDAAFLVLSQFPVASGAPLRLDQVGIHHVALWVDGLAGWAERLRDAGVRFVMEPTEVDARGYGGVKGEKILTCLFEDPDGTIIQLDERL